MALDCRILSINHYTAYNVYLATMFIMASVYVDALLNWMMLDMLTCPYVIHDIPWYNTMYTGDKMLWVWISHYIVACKIGTNGHYNMLTSRLCQTGDYWDRVTALKHTVTLWSEQLSWNL